MIGKGRRSKGEKNHEEKSNYYCSTGSDDRSSRISELVGHDFRKLRKIDPGKRGSYQSGTVGYLRGGGGKRI